MADDTTQKIHDSDAELRPGVVRKLENQLSRGIDAKPTTFRLADLLHHPALERAFPNVMFMDVDVGSNWREGGTTLPVSPDDSEYALRLGGYFKDLKPQIHNGVFEASQRLREREPNRSDFATDEEYDAAAIDMINRARALLPSRSDVIQIDINGVNTLAQKKGISLGEAFRKVLLRTVDDRLQENERIDPSTNDAGRFSRQIPSGDAGRFSRPIADEHPAAAASAAREEYADLHGYPDYLSMHMDLLRSHSDVQAAHFDSLPDRFEHNVHLTTAPDGLQSAIMLTPPGPKSESTPTENEASAFDAEKFWKEHPTSGER